MGIVQPPCKLSAQAFICLYQFALSHWYIIAFTSEPYHILPHWKDVTVSLNDC